MSELRTNFGRKVLPPVKLHNSNNFTKLTKISLQNVIENKDPIKISLGVCFSPGSIHMKSDFQEEIAKKDSIFLNHDIVSFYS